MPVWRLCLFLFLKYSFSPLILLSQQTHSQVCDVPNRSHVPRTPPAKESFPLVKRLVSVHSLFTAVEKQAEGALSLLMAGRAAGSKVVAAAALFQAVLQLQLCLMQAVAGLVSSWQGTGRISGGSRPSCFLPAQKVLLSCSGIDSF